MWQVSVALSAALSGINMLINKYALSKLKIETYKYAFYYDLFFTLLFLIFITTFAPPLDNIGWIVVTVGSVVWCLILILLFTVYKHLDISLAAPLINLTPASILILGILFLNESVTANKIIGLILTLTGVIILTLKRKKSYKVSKLGIVLTVILIGLYSIVAFIDNAGVSYFNIFTYGFGVSIIPMLIVGVYMKLKKMSFKIKKKEAGFIALVTILEFIAYNLILYAYTIAEVSSITILRQLSIAIAVLGGIFIQRKRITAEDNRCCINLFGCSSAIFLGIGKL